MKDIIDNWRAERENAIQEGVDPDDVVKLKSFDFEGHGVLIVARATAKNPVPLCLGLGKSGNTMRLTPCFHDWVPKTLAQGWETGGVIEAETVLHTRWELSPCTSDGKLTRLYVKQSMKVSSRRSLFPCTLTTGLRLLQLHGGRQCDAWQLQCDGPTMHAEASGWIPCWSVLRLSI